MIKAIYCLLLIILVPATKLIAQENKNELEFGFGSSFGHGETIPFWIISNQYALLTENPFNINSRIGYKRSLICNKKIELDAGIRVVNRYSKKYEIYPEEAYGKFRFFFIELQAGLKREIFGNHDHESGSGAFLWSGNSRPMPKISLSTDDYVSIPYTFEFLQIKAGIAHGWFDDNRFVKGALLHHKYIYAKAGGELPVNFSIGMHHFAQWGGVSTNPLYGELPDNFKAYRRIFFASGGGSDSPESDRENAAGNHLGSYNLRTDIKLLPASIGLYWQSVFEDNSGRRNRNLWDGLYGISIEFNKGKLIKSLVLEYLATTYQSGPPDDTYPVDSIPPSFNDNYFNNSIYKMGWSYMDMGIGNPLITSPALTTGINSYDYFSNNRVNAFHSGIAGELAFCEYRLLYTYSNNYGTYSSPFKPKRKQSYFLIDILFRNLIKSIDLSILIGIDHGELVGNNTGIYLNLARKFML